MRSVILIKLFTLRLRSLHGLVIDPIRVRHIEARVALYTLLPHAFVARIIFSFVLIRCIGRLECTRRGSRMLFLLIGRSHARIQLDVLPLPLAEVLSRIRLPRVQFLDRINAVMNATTLIDSLIPTVEQVEIRLLVNRVLLFRRHLLEYSIQRDLKHVIEHFREKVTHPFVQIGHLWIRVDLDEPDSKVLVDHEIEAKEFEGVLPLARVERVAARHVAVDGDVLHSRNKVSLDLQIVLRILLVEILLKLLKTNNVAFLMHTVSVFVLYLKTIVRQVHVLVVLVDLCGVFLTARSQVTSVVKVELIVAVGEAPHANVKLAILEEKRLLDVLLDDPVRELEARLEETDDLVQIIEYLDTLALVFIRRLDEPNILPAVFLRQLLFNCVAIVLS